MKKKNKKNKIFNCNLFPKNRRGFLLTEETLKIVIAVIGLGILVYFLVAIFYSNVQSKKEMDAARSIERVSETLEFLNSTYAKNVTGVQPQGWSFFSFVLGETKPSSCLGKDCVCVCDEVYYDGVDIFGIEFSKDRQIKECNEHGSCLVVENVEKFEPFEILAYSEGITSLILRKDESGKINFVWGRE